MLSLFGKEVRKIRIDKGITMQHLSNSMAISSAHLSGMETGKRTITKGMLCKMIYVLKPSKAQLHQLYYTASLSNGVVRLKLANISDDLKNMVINFSLVFSTLSDNSISKINKILKNLPH